MVACHHLVTGPAESAGTLAPSRTLPSSMCWMSIFLVPAPVPWIIFLSLLPGRPAGRSQRWGAAPRHLIHNVTLALGGTFHKIGFESLALGVFFNDFLRSCPALDFHIHQFIVESVRLVKTLTKLHELKVLCFDSLQVCQLCLLVDTVGPLDVVFAFGNHQLKELDFCLQKLRLAYHKPHPLF